jgi:hypothetical protein
LQVNLPVELRARPLIARQAIYCPEIFPVPRSYAKDFEKMNYILDVILFVAELG